MQMNNVGREAKSVATNPTVGELIMQKKGNMCRWMVSVEKDMPERVKVALGELEVMPCDAFVAHFREKVLPQVVGVRSCKYERDEDRVAAYVKLMRDTFSYTVLESTARRLMEYYACFEDITSPDFITRPSVGDLPQSEKAPKRRRTKAHGSSPTKK